MIATALFFLLKTAGLFIVAIFALLMVIGIVGGFVMSKSNDEEAAAVFSNYTEYSAARRVGRSTKATVDAEGYDDTTKRNLVATAVKESLATKTFKNPEDQDHCFNYIMRELFPAEDALSNAVPA